MSRKATSVFKDIGVAETLSIIHNEYAVIPADKISNNIVLICKKYYIDCL